MMSRAQKAIDPVCGMSVRPETAVARVEYAGHTYYFCSKQCAADFTADPARYLPSGDRPASH